MRRVFLCLLVVLPACSRPEPGAIDETRTLDMGGGERQYRLVVPPDRESPTPLVVVFHGFGGDPQKARELTGFAELAGEQGFAVAFPLGAGIIPAWRTDPARAAPDVAFVRAVVADVSSVITVDSARVFAAGMSNGGGMVGRLACDASDLFAAAGVVAGAQGIGGCDQDRPVPLIAFHGDADPIVPLGGIPFIAQPVTDWVENRALGNGCDAQRPDPVEVADDVSLFTWSGCAADVVFHLVAAGRHGWPGSARSGANGDSTTSIDATALMWQFFSAHPMP